jgi:hypothetical protein
LCLWGPERFFSGLPNPESTYPLFARAKFYRLSPHTRGVKCSSQFCKIAPANAESTKICTLSLDKSPKKLYYELKIIFSQFGGLCLFPPKSAKAKAEAFFSFIRLMRRRKGQVGLLELFREKNRLGRGANLGSRGEICASGAPNDFSRPFQTPNPPTHYSEEAFFFQNSLYLVEHICRPCYNNYIGSHL